MSVDFLRTINKARALENNIVTIFCNRSGSEQDGTKYLGQSSVFYPGGKELVIKKNEGRIVFSI